MEILSWGGNRKLLLEV